MNSPTHSQTTNCAVAVTSTPANPLRPLLVANGPPQSPAVLTMPPPRANFCECSIALFFLVLELTATIWGVVEGAVKVHATVMMSTIILTSKRVVEACDLRSRRRYSVHLRLIDLASKPPRGYWPLNRLAALTSIIACDRSRNPSALYFKLKIKQR